MGSVTSTSRPKEEQKLEMFEHIVIGAGINGSSAAYQLSRRGRKVLLLEKVVT